MKLAIYGTGGSGREAFEILEECSSEKGKWDEIIFVDDTKEEGQFEGKYMCKYNSFKQRYSKDEVVFVIAVGEPKFREKLYQKVKSDGFGFGNIIHKTAVISKSAKIGTGIVLQADVRISAGAVIADNVYINHRTLVGHDVRIGEHSQISCNVALAGAVNVGECVFIGVAVCVRDHINIGKHSIISMGTIILKDVREYKIVMGNPGREISENKQETVFS